MRNFFRGVLVLFGVVTGFCSAFSFFTKDSRGLKIAAIYCLFYVVSGLASTILFKIKH